MGLVLAGMNHDARLEDGSDPSLEKFSAALRLLRRRAALVEMSRDLVVEVLQEAGLDPVMLKGAALIGTVYTDPSLRDMSDLDILIPENRLKVAVRTLAASGYSGPGSWKALCAFRRHHFHLPMHLSGSPTLEIHWALQRPGLPFFRLDAARVQDRAVTIEPEGHPRLRVPAPEHVLLHMVLQNVQEGFARLNRMVDIDRIVAATPSLDWPSVIAEAREGNLGPSLSLSLHLAHRLLGTPVPTGVLAGLRPGLFSRWHLSMLHSVRPCPRKILRGQPAGHLLHLWLLPAARWRLRMLGALLSRTPAMPSLRPPSGPLARVVVLTKIAVLETFFLAASPWLAAWPSGRPSAGIGSCRAGVRSGD
jgi:hypothetical protein